MKTLRRDHLGRYLGKVSYWLHTDDEHWVDHKIVPEDMLFPQHNEDKIYPVKQYNINELNTYNKVI